MKEINVRFFVSTEERFCYSFYHRTGYPVIEPFLPYEKITKMQATFTEEVVDAKIRKAEKLLKERFDEQTWIDLEPDRMHHLNLNRRYLKTIFPKLILLEIESAFSERKIMIIIRLVVFVKTTPFRQDFMRMVILELGLVPKLWVMETIILTTEMDCERLVI